MPQFEFKEEVDELPYTAACIGASTLITDFSTQLFERMWDSLTAAETITCTRYMELMKFEN